MKTKTIAFLAALAPLLAAAGTFPDFGYQPPSDWEGEVFLLSQNYPASLPAATAMPWEAIDYTTDPKGYPPMGLS